MIRSAAERGVVADLERRRKGSRALRAFCWVESMVGGGWWCGVVWSGGRGGPGALPRRR